MGEKYEIVVFTASLAKYADPVLDMLDIHKVVKHRLFRESCFNHKGTYVKVRREKMSVFLVVCLAKNEILYIGFITTWKRTCIYTYSR